MFIAGHNPILMNRIITNPPSGQNNAVVAGINLASPRYCGYRISSAPEGSIEPLQAAQSRTTGDCVYLFREVITEYQRFQSIAPSNPFFRTFPNAQSFVDHVFDNDYLFENLPDQFQRAIVGRAMVSGWYGRRSLHGHADISRIFDASIMHYVTPLYSVAFDGVQIDEYILDQDGNVETNTFSPQRQEPTIVVIDSTEEEINQFDELLIRSMQTPVFSGKIISWEPILP